MGHIPSLTMEVWRSSRSSSKLPSVPLPVLNRWSCIGTCWRSSLTMTLTWTGSSRWRGFPAMMNELLTVPKKHNLPVPSEGEYETLFKKYDPRNDGRLTVDEWMSLVTQEVYKKF